MRTGSRKGIQGATRRNFLKGTTAAVGAGVVVAGWWDETSASDASKSGGTVVTGTLPGTNRFDPHLMSGHGTDIFLQRQILQPLIHLGADLKLEPVLAKEWETTDNKVWKFTLQDGVKFSNGEAFTADDVVYSLDRLRNKELGSSMVDTYAYIESVVADDPLHVTVTLNEKDSTFPAQLTPFPVMMLSKSVKDPAKNIVGTGPFTLESFSPEDRAVLKRNPHYWRKDSTGNQLPYLDGVTMVFSTDPQGMLAGLQGGLINYMGLSATQAITVASDPNLKVVGSSTNEPFTVQIRTDVGPGKVLAFRQALMAGTDRQEMVDLISPIYGKPGNGSLVGPAYRSSYLADGAVYDPTKAKELLSKAGFSNGVEIKLVVLTDEPWPAVATIWKAQMKRIGVDVQIQMVPSDIYYGENEEGTDTWYQTPFGVIDWGARATPLIYFQQVLVTGALWNYSRFSNSEFEAVVAEIRGTPANTAEQNELYKRAQEILIDQVPYISLFVRTEGIAGQSVNLEGVQPAPGWHERSFEAAYFAD